MFNTIPSFPVLQTEKLILRPLVPADAAAIHKLRSDEEVNKMVGRKGSTGIKDAEAFIDKISGMIGRSEGFYWAICLKETVDLVGTICLWNLDRETNKVELGYELLPH